MITMNSLAIRTAYNARRLLTVVAALAALGSVTSARAQFQEWFRPGTVYAAGSLGLMLTSQECMHAMTCEHNRIGGKLFGGYRFTPDLAAEVGFFYLGKFNATQGSNFVPSPSSPQATDLHNRAITYGFDWSNEMFGIARQHIRFGLAHVKTYGTQSFGAGPQSVSEERTSPYLGLGLSYQLNPHIRLYSSYDTMRNRSNQSFHMLSMGMGVEN